MEKFIFCAVSVALGDDNLEISDYNLVQFDHPSNIKGGGFCQ